jgi:lysophospholipase L1-like esterase
MRSKQTVRLWCIAIAIVWFAATDASAVPADEPRIEVTSPRPYQVYQRIGFDPAKEAAGDAEPSGAAEVEVAGTWPEQPRAATLDYRVELLEGGQGTAVDWHQATLLTTADDGAFRFSVLVPAGGWYRLELRQRDAADAIMATATCEPFGVGEVFLVAGQSYATNTNDELLRVTDPALRVSAFNTASGEWSVAHDPQPAPDNTDGGSIWPPLGDALVRRFRVPVAFANVAVGATSSAQWLPGEPLHDRLSSVGASLNRFRAVLWQQGESDVIAATTTGQYVENLQRIRRWAVRAWGFEPVWIAAKSTHHPTVYNDPAGEGRIRDAIEHLSSIAGFAAGPDTDTLTGEYRGDINSRRHFSAAGQRAAAALWMQTLSERLMVTPAGVEAAGFLMPDLHLDEPFWNSTVVHRESGVLIRETPDQPAVAHLAFPAEEVLSVTTANRQHTLDVTNVSLTDDHASLLIDDATLKPIDASAFFPPAGSGTSDKHRTGHPEQNLLYQPGRWFHDRNVEVTYRRASGADATASTPNPVTGELPRTLARLAAGEPLTVGISGDSISTGADASAISKAAPFQPGYPDLITSWLRIHTASEITLKNRAVGGWSVANGVEDLPNLLAESPHLIIVAYGMNDVGRRDPKWYGERTRAIIEGIRSKLPESEIVLVSPMLGHAEWVHTPREMFPLYRDELIALTGHGIALADVTAIWQHLLIRKHDLDLTGNGLNHPNDFGHRLYAQAIVQLLNADQPYR